MRSSPAPPSPAPPGGGGDAERDGDAHRGRRARSGAGVGGRLFAIVGASGVGKDTLMRLARPLLRDVLFVRRVITRPADAHEDHEPCDEGTFAAMEGQGAFCTTWAAHGLRYGVPVGARDHVGQGGTAVLNASRKALGRLRGAVPGLLVVEVTASAGTRAARLAGRGREDAVGIERRLRRASLDYPERASAFRLPNEGRPETAAVELARIVRRAADEASSSHRRVSRGGGA